MNDIYDLDPNQSETMNATLNTKQFAWFNNKMLVLPAGQKLATFNANMLLGKIVDNMDIHTMSGRMSEPASERAREWMSA